MSQKNFSRDQPRHYSTLATWEMPSLQCTPTFARHPPIPHLPIPNTQDIIKLTTENVTMSEEDISWESDRKTRFKQPPGFVSNECAESVSCSDCLGDQYADSCQVHVDPDSGTAYKYWYPDDAKV